MNIIKVSDKDYWFEIKGKEYIYPRVTRIIQDAGISPFNPNLIDKDVLDRAKAFGTAVHKMIELYDTEKLMESKLDSNLLPYLNQYKEAIKKNEWLQECFTNEIFVYSHKWKFAGMADKVCGNRLVDIKTGLTDRIVGVQTAAYQSALNEMGYKIKYRYCLKLEATKYLLLPLKKLTDINVFYSCITINNFKQEK